ncbi:MAG TPA: hypothetical protein VJ900_01795 [Patescibacteria group bacterium]|nr:hypothetical protein [Patescibacteria group bacterium]
MFKKEKKTPFLIAAAYLVSFITIRLLVVIAGAANTPFAQTINENLPEVNFAIGRNIVLFGYHIHHFYFGIILIAIAGWLSIVEDNSEKENDKLAIIYGVGLGLFMDEVGLLLTWGDYYSGLSYLLSIFLLGVFLNILYFPSFWKRYKDDKKDMKGKQD